MRLDFHERDRLTQACVLEYQRLGCPLRARDRMEVVKEVQEQQPNIYAMIQAAEEIPGFPGF